jgi:hypothetical protein
MRDIRRILNDLILLEETYKFLRKPNFETNSKLFQLFHHDNQLFHAQSIKQDFTVALLT